MSRFTIPFERLKRCNGLVQWWNDSVMTSVEGNGARWRRGDARTADRRPRRGRERSGGSAAAAERSRSSRGLRCIARRYISPRPRLPASCSYDTRDRDAARRRFALVGTRRHRRIRGFRGLDGTCVAAGGGGVALLSPCLTHVAPSPVATVGCPSTMAMNVPYEAIGKGFVQQYYAMFDDPAQRPNLINMYNVRREPDLPGSVAADFPARYRDWFTDRHNLFQAETSFMTFEGLQIQGAIKIMEKLTVSKVPFRWFEIAPRLGYLFTPSLARDVFLPSSLWKLFRVHSSR